MATIKDIVRGGDVVVSSDFNVKDAIDLIERHNLPGLVVCDKGRIKGIVTYMELAVSHPNRLVADCTIRRVSPLSETGNLFSAWEIALREMVGIHPVIDERGEPVGIVSITDIIENINKSEFSNFEVGFVPRESSTVLLVIDNPKLQEPLDNHLKKAGFKTVYASSEVEALQKIAAVPDFVLLVTPLSDIDDIKLCEKIRFGFISRYVPLMVICADDDTKNRADLLRAGADDCVVVPYDPEELFIKMDRFIKSRSVLEDLLVKNRKINSYLGQLQQMRELGENVLKRISAGVMITGNDGQVRVINRSAKEMLGISTRDAINKPIETILPDLAAFMDVTSRMVGASEIVVRLKDGRTIPVGFTSTRLKEKDGTDRGVITIFKDLTEINQMRRELREKEKLATIGKLAGGIAHEIKNPLFAISSGIQILGYELAMEDDQKQILDTIFKETMRVNRLIKQLLTYSTTQELKRSPQHVEKMVEDVISLHQGIMKSRDISVNMTVQEGMIPVSVERDKFVQVMVNLLQNAMDVTEPGGMIEIEAGINEAKNCAYIEVKDSGPGIVEDEMEKIFELFYSKKKGSSGIGLAISRKIVMEHGGQIYVKPSVARGATFVVELPLEVENA